MGFVTVLLSFLKSVAEFVMNNWKIFAIIIILVMISWVSYNSGEKHIQQLWNADTAKTDLANAQQAIAVEQAKEKQLQDKINTLTAQAAISDAVATTFDQTTTKIITKTQYLTKEIPVYVTPSADSKCVVPVGLPKLWNQQNSVGASATGADGTAPAGANDTPSALKLSDIAAEHGAEAELCLRTTAQLIGLQDWVARQYNLAHPDDVLSVPVDTDDTPQPTAGSGNDH